MRELQLRIGMAHQVFDIRPFQVFSVFRITSASQNLSVSQGNDEYEIFFCKKSGQNLSVRVMRSTEIHWNGLMNRMF